MTVNSIVLSGSAQRRVPVGTFGLVSAVLLPDGSPRVHLSVEADGEHDFVLRSGETFTVRDEIWKLDRVEDREGRGLTVFLIKVS